MRYLIIVRNPGYTPSDRPQLMARLRGLGLRVINVRVATDHVEVDLDTEDVAKVLPIVIANIGCVIDVVDLSVERRVVDPLGEFVRLFNAERYWEAHEVLEGVWRVSGDVGIQGLIVLAAAYVKLQEGNPEAFMRLLERASELIMRGNPRGVDTREIMRVIEEIMRVKKPIKLKLSIVK
jgi:predicted metal-dependent hydrolase|nr:MAG: hypothetical protein TU36_05790 [Vulcanisaeta sp. AZ3]